MSQALTASRRLVLASGLAAWAAACAPKPAVRSVTVFAAASLTDAMSELARLWRDRGEREPTLSFGASGALVRQIQAGAPADIVMLADETWMDRLEAAGLIAGGSRKDLLANRLVFIVGPGDSPAAADPVAWLRTGAGRLVIGEPASVPAGAYAREWLERRGLWESVRDRVVTAADVRAVRAFVARGEADLGVVYRSDALRANSVRIVGEPPAAEQPRILYPAAMTSAAASEASGLLQFLGTAEAAAVFERHGFTTLGSDRV